jgi:hypothetical protein
MPAYLYPVANVLGTLPSFAACGTCEHLLALALLLRHHLARVFTLGGDVTGVAMPPGMTTRPVASSVSRAESDLTARRQFPVTNPDIAALTVDAVHGSSAMPLQF